MTETKHNLNSLQEWLEIDSTSPSGLRWKKQSSPIRPAGSTAGTQNKEGYWRVAVGKRFVQAHQAVLILSGVFPESDDLVVDHINRNKSDNRLGNLRWVTHAANQRNQSKRTKRSLFKHTYQRPSGKWQFQCKQKELGLFCQVSADTAEQAYYGGLAKRLELHWI